MRIEITPNIQEELDEITTRLEEHGYYVNTGVDVGGPFDTIGICTEEKAVWGSTRLPVCDDWYTTIEEFCKMFPLPEDGPTLRTIAKEVEIVRGDEIFRLSMGHDNFSISASWVDSPDKSDYVELPMEAFDDIIKILNDLKGEIYGTDK